jgi:hypothetical protein
VREEVAPGNEQETCNDQDTGEDRDSIYAASI